MCGLVGYSGKKRPNVAALKLMSIFIRDRGKDSVGFLMNNSVSRGVWESYQKDFGDPLNYFSRYVFNKIQKVNWNSNICIIHNRSATRGIRSLENSHPFVYEKDGVTHYFAHNGTLSNEDELCKEYGLNSTDFTVDSKLLGHIIVHFGFDVLTKYKGYAAFLYYRDDMPNSLFVFKGESLEGGVLKEERPLYVNTSVRGEAYFCSNDAAIECANDLVVNSTIDLPTNKLFIYENGKLVSETIYDRTHIENKPPVVHRYKAEERDYTKKISTSLSSDKKAMPKLCFYQNPERNPQPKAGNKFYYFKGLYYKNGHYANGAYVISSDGLIHDNFYYENQVLKAKNQNINIPEGHREVVFHCGLLLKDFEALNIVKGLIQTVADIPNNLPWLAKHLHDDHYLFYYEYSEARQGQGLKMYTNGHGNYAAKTTKNPFLGYYKYIFYLTEQSYEVHLKSDEEKVSKEANDATKSDTSGKYSWQETSDDDTLLLNFKTSTIDRTAVGTDHAKNSLEIIKKRLVFLENALNANMEKGDGYTIEKINILKTIMILRTIISDPQSLPLDDIFEEYITK